jgi:excisionase family DNA binding protein
VAGVQPDIAAHRRDRVLAASREQFASRREDVEAMLHARNATRHEEPEVVSKKKITKPRTPPPEKPVPDSAVEVPALPGRGGEHHKYLQQLIKRWAEGRGYQVTLEKPILDGLGCVDVALTKGSRAIACEISVTTDAEHEIGNVQKCLAAGFEEVIFISSDKKKLTAVRHALVAALSTAQYRQVKFLTPEETFSFVDGFEAKAAPASPSPDANDLMTAREVEELLRIDVKTVYSYVHRGLLPYVKIQSNVRFLRSEILKWMEERQYKPGRGSAK